MAHLAARKDDHFHNSIDKPSIIRAQLAPKPPRRDAPFPTYLKPNDNLPGPGHRVQDSEISIFEAEKYFNGAHEPNNNSNKNTNTVYTLSTPKQPEIPTISRLSLSTPKQSVSSISRPSSVSDDSYGRNYRARSFHATPTASSEASWNSQTGLLKNPPGLAPVSIRSLHSAPEGATKKSGNWFLRGNICPCSGKKSVNIKQSSSESETSKTPPTPQRIVQLNRISSSGGSAGYLYSSNQTSPITARATLIPEQPITKAVIANANPNGFTFPILSTKETPSKRIIIEGRVSGSETPRDSIEIFQPRESPKSRRASYDDDLCSEASSDLFEIESFSTANGNQTTLFPRRDSLEDNFNVRRLRIATITKSAQLTEDYTDEPVTPSIAPTECYAPSEVSVDWSVTTAEGFDRASLAGFSVSASEIGYAALRNQTRGVSTIDESKRKGNGGLLTSCRCEKAVNVGPAPIRASMDNNGGHGHGVVRSTRSTLMPSPFVAESLAHRRSL